MNRGRVWPKIKLAVQITIISWTTQNKHYLQLITLHLYRPTRRLDDYSDVTNGGASFAAAAAAAAHLISLIRQPQLRNNSWRDCHYHKLNSSSTR